MAIEHGAISVDRKNFVLLVSTIFNGNGEGEA